MIPTFAGLQQQKDEYELLHLVREQVEPVLDENSEFARYRAHQFRIASNALRIFEDSSSPSLRTWFVTVDVATNQYTVQVRLDRLSETWAAVLARWETPSHGLYYSKPPVPWTYEGAYARLDVWSNSSYYGTSHEQPIGEGDLVGYTLEPIPRAVYWLFDRCIPAPALRRQISGNFVLDERRFHALPQTVGVELMGKWEE